MVKRSQTLILAEDGDDGALFNHADSNGKDKPGNSHEGVKQPQSWNCHQHAKCDNKTPQTNLRRRSLTNSHVKLNLSPVTEHARRTGKGDAGGPYSQQQQELRTLTEKKKPQWKDENKTQLKGSITRQEQTLKPLRIEFHSWPPWELPGYPKGPTQKLEEE